MNFTMMNISDVNKNLTENQSLAVYHNATEHIPYGERPETYFVPVLFFLIFIVGCLGNGTLVVIFLRHKTMRNVPNTYIFSLALADLLVIIISLPFTSVIYTLDSWPWGETICKVSEAAKDISSTVSVFTLTALSADRFFAIVDPLKKFHTSSGGRKATRITVSTAIGIWILAIICSLPGFFGSSVHEFFNEDKTFGVKVCYPFPTDWLNGNYAKVIVMSKFLILYVIPLLVIFGFYVSMAVSLMISTRNVPGELQGMHRQIKARKKVAITVLVFVAVFAICFLPIYIFLIFFYFEPNAQDLYNPYWHYLRVVGFCLCYTHSCANPIALYFISGAFRKHFNRYLLCKRQKRNRCSTCAGPQATSMSLISNKRQQSINRKPTIIGKRLPSNAQETSITLLGNGHSDTQFCNKII